MPVAWWGINDHGPIRGSYATGAVSSTSTSTSLSGGLAGSNTGQIRGSYATGAVTTISSYPSYPGGLVGINSGSIAACYATGEAAGGLVYSNAGSIVACYATGGLLFSSSNTGTITNSYYNSSSNTGGDASHQPYAQEVLQLIGTTDYGDSDELYPASSWNIDIDNLNMDDDLSTDIDDPWDFGTNAQYPVLKLIDVNRDGTLDATDLALQRNKFAPSFFQSSYTFTSSAVVGTVADTVRSVTANAHPLVYEIVEESQPDGTIITSGFSFSLSAVDEAGFMAQVGEIRTTSTSLRIGDRYTLSIKVNQTNGLESRASVVINIVAGKPAAPSLTAIPNATNPITTIDLSWPEPHNGGSIITAYTLEVSTNGSTFTSISGYDGTSLSYSHTGLSPGTTRHYRVAATNEIGTSPYSDLQTVSTNNPLPGAPTNLRAVAVNAEQISLSWIAGNNEGTATMSYMLQVSEDNVNFTDLATIDAAHVAYSHTGLDHAKTYYYQVAAINIAGRGPYSSTSTTTTAAATLTLVPTSLDFEAAGSTTSVSITSNASWTSTTNSPSWLSIEGASSDTEDGTIMLKAAENLTTISRTAEITVRVGTLTEVVSVTQAAAAPMLTLTPKTLSFNTAGSTSFFVTSNLPNTYTWEATSSATEWLTLDSRTGTGNSTITATATENSTATVRTASITIRVGALTEVVSVTQAAATLTLTPASLDFDATGSTTSVSIASNASWIATSNPSWLSIEETSSGTGDGTIMLKAAENPTATVRTASITVRVGALTEVVSVTQAAAAPRLALTSTSLDFDAAGSTKSVSIASNASWTSTTNSPTWLSIEETSSGTGDGTIMLKAAENPTATVRTASITVRVGALTEVVSVTQAAAAPRLTLVPTSLDFEAAGSTTSVSITSNASWTSTTNSPSWLSIESASSGTEDGTIMLKAAENLTTISRTAEITVRVGTLTEVVSVTQAAAAPMLTLTSTSLDFDAAGSTKSVSIASNASWTSTTNSPTWLSIEETSSGTGDGTIMLKAAENPTATVRTASITVRVGALTEVVSVTQAAATLTLTPASLDFDATGSTTSVSIASNASWIATSNPSWLSIEETSSGTGDGTIMVKAAENLTTISRTAEITVRVGVLTKVVSVRQAAAVARLRLAPETLIFTAAGSTSFFVTSNLPNTYTWEATSSATEWLTLDSPAGTGNSTITATVTENTTDAVRRAEITVRVDALTQVVSVTQEVVVITVPDAPTSLTATAVGFDQVSLQWEAPTHTGESPITGYKIDTFSADAWGTLISSTSSTDLSYMHTGLDPVKRYYYRVSAINDIGLSLPSGTASAITEAAPPTATAPDAPTGLTAVAVSFDQINLRWEAPTQTGGRPITAYGIDTLSVDTWGTLISNTGSTDLSYMHTGLDPVKRYYYRVSAINDIGLSLPSETASATTKTATPTAVVPDAPTGLTAVAVSFDQINLRWEAPTQTGGRPITAYGIDTLSVDTWGTLISNTGSTDLSYMHTGLDPVKRYYYRVSAINDIGLSLPSETASATTKTATPTAVVPDAPTGLTAVAVSFDQINLRWEAPTQTGGRPITAYGIEISATGNGAWATILTGITETSHQHTDLSPGKTKFYRVYAVNFVGRSLSSPVAHATTEAIVPNPPTNPIAQATSHSQINLSWLAPIYDGGSAITGYKIEASTTGHVNSWEVMIEDTKSTDLIYQHKSLGPATTYYYRIATINSEGAGTPSSAIQATTLEEPIAATLGVSTVANGEQLSLYPNPASDEVRITLPTKGAYTVTIHTLTGVAVLHTHLQGNGLQTIDLSSLREGVYIVNMRRQDGYISTHRLIKAAH